MGFINENEEVFVTDNRETSPLKEINRITTGGHTSLFGSSIKHNNAIAIRIKRASKQRSLSRDWFSSGKELIEIYLSPAQFAEAITTLNMGTGTPCTIKRVEGKNYKFAEENSRIEEHTKEFEHELKKISEKTIVLANEARAILDGTGIMTKKEREALCLKISMLVQSVTGNIPFYKNQFDEQIEKTIGEAKAEIEAFTISAIHTAGLDAIKSNNNLSIQLP